MSAYSIATRGLAGRKIPQGVLAAINTLLFGASEQGAWYDPADLSTLFQDTAGTTPVTAVEQAVALVLDKSGRGNHASQATSTKRPKYSRRVNLLTKTENMVPTPVPGTAWTFGAFSNWVAPTNLGPTLAPDGSNNAVGIRSVGAGGISTLVHRASVFPSTTYKFTVQVRKVAGEDQTGLYGVRLLFQTGNNNALVSEGASSVVIGTSISDVWQQFEISYTTPATGVNQVEVGIWFSSAAAAAVAVWGGSLTLATDAHLPYQRVNTPTDYDADPAKFPAYLRFDGVDDALSTGNINFTGTDKMTVWAGITKLSDAGLQMIAELSANAGATSGSFWLLGGDNSTGAPGWGGRSGGTTRPLMYGVDSAAPINSVLVLASDISGAVSSLRSNGALKATATSSHGTGSFVSAQLYIGTRAGTSLPFNGRIYSLIVRGAKSSLSQIEATENLIRQTMRLP